MGISGETGGGGDLKISQDRNNNNNKKKYIEIVFSYQVCYNIVYTVVCRAFQNIDHEKDICVMNTINHIEKVALISIGVCKKVFRFKCFNNKAPRYIIFFNLDAIVNIE